MELAKKEVEDKKETTNNLSSSKKIRRFIVFKWDCGWDFREWVNWDLKKYLSLMQI